MLGRPPEGQGSTGQRETQFLKATGLLEGPRVTQTGYPPSAASLACKRPAEMASRDQRNQFFPNLGAHQHPLGSFKNTDLYVPPRKFNTSVLATRICMFIPFSRCFSAPSSPGLAFGGNYSWLCAPSRHQGRTQTEPISESYRTQQLLFGITLLGPMGCFHLDPVIISWWL